MPMNGLKRSSSVLQVAGETNFNPKKPKMETDADKRLHLAMLKVRFPTAFMKASEKLTLNMSKEELEKKKSDAAADIRAAQKLLKLHKQKERQSARLRLDKIQRTIEWNDAMHVQ